MSDKALQSKVAYFGEIDALDSNDESGLPDPGITTGKLIFAGAKSMPPPPDMKRQGSFNGPPLRERQKEFDRHAAKQRAVTRQTDSNPTSSGPAPEIIRSSPATMPKSRGSLTRPNTKRNASMSDIKTPEEIPFYRRLGETPRELKMTNAKPATKIQVQPEHKQLFKEQIIYFYPNDDTSLPRRRRIHKMIQLGAAWVKVWRDDVTHVVVDDENKTYNQLLRHLNIAGLPRKVILIKFDPYIPQCIEYGTLLDHTAGRFLVKGAPGSRVAQTQAPPDSQASLPIKQSRRQMAAHASPLAESATVNEVHTESQSGRVPNSSDEIVPDSFIETSSPPIEEATKPPMAFQNAHHDALSKAIQETKAIAHLPLDDDEDSDTRPGSSGDADSGTESEEDAVPTKKRLRSSNINTSPTKKTKWINQHNFQCMNPTGSLPNNSNPNARTIEILDQMCKYYDQMQDQWRTLAYRKAIATLRKQSIKISTARQAAALPFIGSRLADKIEEISLTDRLRRLDTTRNDPTDKILRVFLGVYGAGLIQANKWIQAGHRTLDDLVAKAKLTDSQKIGIEHYDDFAQRIPRAEVKAHGDYVASALRSLDPKFEATIMGSYRRGTKDSGDIDIIITKPGASVSEMRDVVFHTLVPRLFKTGFLKAKLATSHTREDGTKWHGASCLLSSTTWRRLDLLLVPQKEMGAALLYFTGNDIFNRSIRLLASKKGMRLNQRGLYKDVVRGRNREKLNEGTLVEREDEKKIFEILGVPWREPTERIC